MILSARKNPAIFSSCLLLPAVLFLAGCATIPFDSPQWQSLPDDLNPRQMAEEFATALPKRFVSEETLVFRFFRRKIAALGYSRIDRQAGTFEVLCLNHLGIQLFYLTGDKHTTELKYAIPEFAEHPEFIEAVGEDIRRIHFHLMPDPEARIDIRRNRIIFSQNTEDGTLEHVFGGPELLLYSKRLRGNWRTIWEVNYYEHEKQNQGLVPRGVVLRNRQHNYRLTLRIREISPR